MSMIEDALSGGRRLAVGVGTTIVGSAFSAIGTAIRPVAKGLAVGALFVGRPVVALAGPAGTLAAYALGQVSDLVGKLRPSVRPSRNARAGRSGALPRLQNYCPPTPPRLLSLATRSMSRKSVSTSAGFTT